MSSWMDSLPIVGVLEVMFQHRNPQMLLFAEVDSRTSVASQAGGKIAARPGNSTASILSYSKATSAMLEKYWWNSPSAAKQLNAGKERARHGAGDRDLVDSKIDFASRRGL